MTENTLKTLIGIYNTLFNMSVTGDSVIPMANVLLSLQNVIQESSAETAASGQDECLPEE